MDLSRIVKILPFLLIGSGLTGLGLRWADWSGKDSKAGANPAINWPDKTESRAGKQRGTGAVVPSAPSSTSPLRGAPALPGSANHGLPLPPQDQAMPRRDRIPGPGSPSWTTVLPSTDTASESDSTPTIQRPGRAFSVPAGLADRPLPVFLRFPGVGSEGSPILAGAVVPPRPGTSALPAPQEQRLLAEAERIFADAMERAPVQDATAPEYEDWWRAARERSENYLRLALGWDRFNTLSRADMVSMQAPLPMGEGQLPATESGIR
jgi:hypothetical protein